MVQTEFKQELGEGGSGFSWQGQIVGYTGHDWRIQRCEGKAWQGYSATFQVSDKPAGKAVLEVVFQGDDLGELAQLCESIGKAGRLAASGVFTLRAGRGQRFCLEAVDIKATV